jgi:hypothetical protein
LVGFSNPGFFLFVVAILNGLGVWNACYARYWRVNLVLEKVVILMYHFCFIALYFFPQQSLNISIVTTVILIFGGIHELLTVVLEKIYFMYFVIKQKKIKNNKVSNIESEDVKVEA